MGYIEQTLWDIFDKGYGIYLESYGIYWSIGYIKQKLRDGLGKILGYRKLKLWDILWDIFDKNLRGYICKLWVSFRNILGYKGKKLWDMLC